MHASSASADEEEDLGVSVLRGCRRIFRIEVFCSSFCRYVNSCSVGKTSCLTRSPDFHPALSARRMNGASRDDVSPVKTQSSGSKKARMGLLF